MCQKAFEVMADGKVESVVVCFSVLSMGKEGGEGTTCDEFDFWWEVRWCWKWWNPIKD